MKHLLSLLIFLPVFVFSQEDFSKEIDSLKTRLSELEKVKNKMKISGHEVTYKSLPKVQFNFENPNEITVPKKIKEGDFFQIEITGINLNQYLILLEYSDTVYSSPLEFPTFGTLDLSSLSSLVNSLALKTSTVSSDELGKAIAKISELPAENKSFNPSLLIQADSGITRILKAIDSDISKNQKQNLLRDLINSRIDKSTIQSKKFLANLKITNEIIEKKKYNYMAYRILRLTNDTSNDYKPDIMGDLVEYDKLRISLKKLKSRIDKEIKSLQEFIVKDKIKVFLSKTENINLKDSLEEKRKILVETSNKTSKAMGIVSTSNIEKQLKYALNLYSGQTYTSLPIQFNGEQAEVSIKFIPKDSISGLQPYNLSPIKFPSRKYYWSVGASIYWANLESERVGTEKMQVNDSTQRYQLLKEESLKQEMGVALLLRGGLKLTPTPLGIHVAVGTGLSLGEEVKPRMLLGLGITVGQKHSLAIDGGIIGGYVSVISDEADYTKGYIDKPEVTINEFKKSAFLSIGYTYRF